MNLQRLKLTALGITLFASALAMSVGIVPSGALAKTDSVKGTLTIHERVCFADELVDDPYAECHGNVIGQASEYYVVSGDLDSQRSTDPATGNVTFIVEGTNAAISDPWGSDRYFHDFQAFCSVEGQGEPLELYQVGEGASGGVGVNFPEGASVICDWYLYADPNTRALPSASPGASPMTR